MCQKQINIIASWVMGICALGLYFYTENIYISFVIILISIPLRKNLYIDESLHAVINECPIVGFIAAFISLMWSMVLVFKIIISSEKLFYELVSDSEYLMVFLPIMFLYLYRDIIFFLKLTSVHDST